MKKRYFNIKTAFIIVFGMTLISACVNKDEFFELPDRGGIGTDIWNAEGAIQLHLNRAYEVVIPDFGSEDISNSYMHGRAAAHFASDENFLGIDPDGAGFALSALGMGTEVLSNNSIFYAAEKYSGNKGDNKYFDIARCNAGIKYIPEGTLPKNIQDKYLGQYYALRAMVYFGLVKVYGGVPLLLEPQDPENLTTKGRASAAECFKLIVSDLDSAMSKLRGVTWVDATDRGRLDLSAAAALKAKVLLYWASPQFNPLNDPKHPYDPERWKTALAANKEAYTICVNAQHSLVPNYADIFRLEGTKNPENIIVRPYSTSIVKRGHNIEMRTRPASEGGSAIYRYVATSRLIDAYPMKDGRKLNDSTRLDIPNKYKYDETVFWVNRDPRLDATIAYNGSSWALNGKSTRRQWAYVGAKGEGSADKGFFCKRFTIPTLTTASYTPDIGGGNGVDWIEMRFAEVIINYAECANETGDLEKAKELMRMIRKRAGIEEVSTANDYGLGAVSTLLEMRELIFNERFIEFAFEEKRNSDLRRMRRWHELSGVSLQTYAIYPKAGAASILETTNSSGVMFRESLNLNNKATYLQYFEAPQLASPSAWPIKTINIPEYQTFYTFDNDFVLRGEDIRPTIGWAGGTFDPLD